MRHSFVTDKSSALELSSCCEDNEWYTKGWYAGQLQAIDALLEAGHGDVHEIERTPNGEGE